MEFKPDPYRAAHCIYDLCRLLHEVRLAPHLGSAG